MNEMMEQRRKRAKEIKTHGTIRKAVEAGSLEQFQDISLSEAVVLGLINQGVKTFVGIFGHGMTDVGEVLRIYEEESAVKTVNVRNEVEASHVAAMLRWKYNEVPAVFTSIGPGALQAAAGSLVPLANGLGVYYLMGDETSHSEGPNMQQIPKREQELFLRLLSTFGPAYSLHTPEAVFTALKRGDAAVHGRAKRTPFYMLLPMNIQPKLMESHLVPDLPLSVLGFVAVVDYPFHYSGILALGGISGIISLYSIISAIHVLFFIGSMGRQAAARPHILVQTIFIYLKFSILPIGLYDVGLLIKAYLIFTNQVIRCVCTVIPEIRTACLIVDICFPCAFILADIRHKGKGYFPGIVPGKMPVSQLPVHIRGNLFHNDVCAVGKHDGMIKIIVLPIPGIALQRGHITIRPSVCIAVPGNSQPVIQSGKTDR